MAAGNGLPYWQWCWQLDHLIVGSCRTRVRGNSRNRLYAAATLIDVSFLHHLMCVLLEFLEAQGGFHVF